MIELWREKNFCTSCCSQELPLQSRYITHTCTSSTMDFNKSWSSCFGRRPRFPVWQHKETLALSGWRGFVNFADVAKQGNEVLNHRSEVLYEETRIVLKALYVSTFTPANLSILCKCGFNFQQYKSFELEG